MKNLATALALALVAALQAVTLAYLGSLDHRLGNVETRLMTAPQLVVTH